MSKNLSRRDFLKLAGLGTAAAAVLTGCGPAARYVVREPYTQMPEYTYNGQSTFYATTCRECPAGCGIVVRTVQGRAIKVEGNPFHPLNRGKTCARGQAALQGLYNPDRITGPLKAVEDRGLQEMTWEDAVTVIKDVLTERQPDEIAFLMGLAPDHLFDLVTEIASALGAPAPLRYGATEMFDARLTLAEASRRLFRADSLPFFDLAGADFVLSFGANFLETWLSPVAYTRGFSSMRKQAVRGTLIQFEARLSQTAAKADTWVPLVPGTEGLVALAIGRLAAEARGGALPQAFLDVDVAAAAEASGVDEETLRGLAGGFAAAEHPLAIPGGGALGASNGLEAAQAILAINALAGNVGQPGGVLLTPAVPVQPRNPLLPNTLADLNDLVERMRSGAVKVLFVHGTNPVFDLPPALGFAEALENVPLVISFASFPDETAARADFIFPDHTGLESWGYQRVPTGADRAVLSGAQPVVVPFYDTRATADVLLAAVQAAGGELAAAAPYADEVAFLQAALVDLVGETGFFNDPEIRTFLAHFQQYGGWWREVAGLDSPSAGAALDRPLPQAQTAYEGEGEFHLIPFLSPILGEAGANKPWLQETPDPMTTVTWGTWVEINPETAHELGIEDDDVVRIVSDFGSIEVPVYKYPAIRPDTLAIPFGQGHSAYGRYAQGRGANPAAVLAPKINGAGDLAFTATRVRIEKTGRKQQLARLESRMGVYGENH